MDLNFQHLDSLAWLWLVAGIGILAWWGVLARRRAIRRFADVPMLARLAPRLSLFRPAVRSVFAVLGLFFLVLALADPRWGVRYVEVNRSGMDVMFVVDVSRSMLARDASPSRLDRARLFIEGAVDSMAGDRVGLVDFAGDAAIKSPLTLNYDAFKNAIEELSPRSATRGGSMLGDAIRVAADAFGNDEPGGKAIVILSDGEDMESFPIEAAEAAQRDHGVRVYTVGIGDAVEGARIPTLIDGQPSWLLHENQEVWTRMDPDLLQSVAEAGGGVFVPAGTSLVDLGEFFKGWITTIDLQDQEEGVARQLIPRFQWFAGISLICFVLESLIAERRRRPLNGTPRTRTSSPNLERMPA
jgi:Ca-activated chloride channel family protein